MIIITPSIRQSNLARIKESINFDKAQWIIVYDTSKDRKYEPIFNHPKILEVGCSHPGISGNPQRNFGLDLVDDGFVYFLDDDNIVHPGLWDELDTLDDNFFYTFDQEQDGKLLRHGDNPRLFHIDTAQAIIPKKIIGDMKWNLYSYCADGLFISEIYNTFGNRHKYINKTLSYCNYLAS